MVSLADVKEHMRIEHTDDDELLERLIAAASDHLASIGVNMEASPLPPAVEQAQRYLLQVFYDGRTEFGEFTVDRLIAPYKEIGI